MKQQFTPHRFNSNSCAMIERINAILDEYEGQGYKLSLRQLYYQLVSRAVIENSVKSYKTVGGLVSVGRLAGLIDWDMIEDRSRSTTMVSHWESPGDILQASADCFHIDKWLDQEWHIEVMVEKDALSGVLEPVCAELDINVTANRGYSSSSTMYEIGQRLMYKQAREDKRICIMYLGDHDPSGIDMTRDVEERLSLFSWGRVTVERLALNWEQIEEWQPPENPAKETDSRFAAYQAEFGDSSWELDAVEPATLAELVTEAVSQYRDVDKWDTAVDKEDTYIAELMTMAKKYNG